MAGLYDYLTPGQPESYISNLDPAFAGALQRFVSASPGITIYSGARSNEKQAQLFSAAVQKYGSEAAARVHVAPPGKSMHNIGDAADLRYASDAARDWAHANAEKFGLNYPMSYEPWHIEPIGARQRRQGNAQPETLQAMASPQTPVDSSLMTPEAQGAGQAVLAPLQPLTGRPQQETPWLQSTSYSPDAIMSDLFAGQNPLKRLAYQKLTSLFA